MADYTKTTNFTAKDALASGDPDKIVRGSDFDTEFDNLASTVATKAEAGDNISIFTNDSGFLDATTGVEPGDNISTLTNDSGFITGVAFAEVTAKPTTLVGYGITDAATSAQGATADSALQPSDNISTLTNDSGFLDATTGVQPGDNISTLVNDSAYLTSYTETDTLDSVVGRGATTTTAVTVGGLHVNATTAVEMPTGTEAQRPSPVAGMLRYNTDTASFEGYTDAWGAIGGVGGGSWEATADGAITIGDTLVQNVDGTVSPITSSLGAATFGSQVTFDASTSTAAYPVSAYSPTDGKFVVFWRNPTTTYMNAAVGTVTGTAISWGTAVEVTTVAGGYDFNVVWIADENSFLFTYEKSSSTHVRAGQISGTSITLGTEGTIDGADPTRGLTSGDIGNSQGLVVYYIATSAADIYARVIGVSGTAVTVNSRVTVVAAGIQSSNSGFAVNGGCIKDPVSGYIMVPYRHVGTLKVVPILVTGTVPSGGTVVTGGSLGTFRRTATLMTDINKILFVDAPSSGSILSATVITPGATPTIGTTVTRAATLAGYGGAVFDPSTNIVGCYYVAVTTNYPTFIGITVSGTTPSFGTPVTINTTTSTEVQATSIDTTTNQVLWTTQQTGWKGSLSKTASVTTNAASFIGFAGATVADTEAVPVNVYSQINTNQSGLTIGEQYWVAFNGTLSTSDTGYPIAGTALSATDIQVGI